MATVEQAIKEIDVVELREAVSGWPSGTLGTVVSDHGDVKMVEISNHRGEILDLPLVPVEKLRLKAKHSSG